MCLLVSSCHENARINRRQSVKADLSFFATIMKDLADLTDLKVNVHSAVCMY